MRLAVSLGCQLQVFPIVIVAFAFRKKNEWEHGKFNALTLQCHNWRRGLRRFTPNPLERLPSSASKYSIECGEFQSWLQ